MDVKNNVFALSNPDGGFVTAGAILQNDHQTGLHASDNRLGLNLSGERRSCDFDGDRAQDSVMATGVIWWSATHVPEETGAPRR